MPMGPSGTTQPIQITGMPQVVPADFVGMIFRGWPLYSSAFWLAQAQPYPTSAPPSPVGSLTFKSTRLFDTAYSFWGHIERNAATQPGVYTWTYLDQQITAFRALGVNVGLCLGGTPTTYSSTNHAFYDITGGDGYPANASPALPGTTGLQALSNFITALVTRYNTAGGAWQIANPGLGKGLQWLEIANEPSWNGVTPNGVFWGASPGQLVDWGYTIRTAAKAVDAAILITSPGFNTAQNAQTFLTATGTINTTVTGASLCDAVQVHHYNVNLPGMSYGVWPYDFMQSPNVGMAGWKAAISAGGNYAGGLTAATVPIWMGEGGFDYTSVTNELTGLLAQPASYRSTLWARMMMLGAANGMKKWLTYTWDSPYPCTPMNDPQGVPAACNLIASQVAGKTITSASYIVGGAVTLNFSDSTVLTV